MLYVLENEDPEDTQTIQADSEAEAVGKATTSLLMDKVDGIYSLVEKGAKESIVTFIIDRDDDEGYRLAIYLDSYELRYGE